MTAGDSLRPDYWQPMLDTLTLGRSVIYSPEMTSTNAVLKKAAHNRAVHGCTALCDRQTHGRGRMGRSWESAPPAAQFLCSVLITLPDSVENTAALTLLTGLSMAMAIETFGISPCIKWPNDLLLGSKKCCGILLEAATDDAGQKYAILGTGVNMTASAYPETMSDRATSLEAFSAQSILRSTLLIRYLNILENGLSHYIKEGFTPFKSEYEKRCITLSCCVRVTGSETFDGFAQSIDDNGALIVLDTNHQTRHLNSGYVSVRGVTGYV
jgi:BirA family biotin operon repressor/biotin-[acetyl-CoA-carboxylase] ligase